MQVVSHHTLLPPAASAKARPAALQPQIVEQLTPTKPAEEASGYWQSGKFSFSDFIDMINPLQHLPVISGIYRKLTGDEMGDGPRMIGGAVYGALLGSWVSGLASAVANVFVSHSTGKDIPEHIMSVAMPARTSTTPAARSPAFAPTHADHTPRRADAMLVAAQREVDVTRRANNLHAYANSVPQAASGSRAAEVLSQLEEAQASAAIVRYRQHIAIDDIKRDTHYWA